MVKERKAAVSWNSVKAGLSGFDRTALLGLIQDLYAASKDNQAFLHARLNLGGDPLKPYKAVISRSVCPDIFKNQPVSVAKAKKAIADYKKAIGYPEGMAELSVEGRQHGVDGRLCQLLRLKWRDAECSRDRA
jgi:hypothetical protein